MCRPDWYGVEYVINPWMEGHVGRVDRAAAIAQWEALHAIVSAHADVRLLPPHEGLPDMPFVANAGLVWQNTCFVSRFRFAQRERETPHHVRWFGEAGFEVQSLKGSASFEGEGDALFQPGHAWLWAGYGVRTDLQVYAELQDRLNVDIVPLRLVDERFYHLDTCFCPLPGGRVLFYPDAFDSDSRERIRGWAPADRRIEVSDDDALRFACNAIVLGNTWISSFASPALTSKLKAWGFEAQTTPLDQFLLAGGGAKCLVLWLDNETPALPSGAPHPRSTIRERMADVQGQLLDSGLMNRMLDCITDAGGSFEIDSFAAGLRRDQDSRAQIRIVAPTQERLDAILQDVVRLGARVQAEESDARLAAAPARGVAPGDFYGTTIYPTAVRVNGEWVDVTGQRMDAAIVVSTSKGGVDARCVLLRDIAVGNQVVCGADGIRVSRPKSSSGEEPFGFMSAEVSSERRVEAVIEVLAWEMERIRRRRGKTVVVAGPVVVHSGGAPHLARLVKLGYVQALLGGNAIAVHDVENALYGTSLGVDLKRGAGVRGGHHHHLRVINAVRERGGLRGAVETGLIHSGILYECIRAGVPYVLAGSIRDDGPLPDTEMDLIEAQAQYAAALAGADLVLMLATMLHSIGAGNMLPAGVRIVCVDINPAAVTKLADRGSVESTGIVTDVGLFLNLLAARLDEVRATSG
jgi:lysine-ketoglutarate reductase/saccharopine dehydrogenase-like protein (TIGR00300 family)